MRSATMPVLPDYNTAVENSIQAIPLVSSLIEYP